MTSEEHAPLSDEHRVLSGKRRAPRRRRVLDVRLLGPGGAKFAARTVDVSRGGMLVEITDLDFMPLGDQSDLLPFAARVAAVFPHGIDASFGDGAVQVHVVVVRLVARPGDATMLLGCRFQPDLSEFDCRLLGVDTGGDETEDMPDEDVQEKPAEDPVPLPTTIQREAPGLRVPVAAKAPPKIEEPELEPGEFELERETAATPFRSRGNEARPAFPPPSPALPHTNGSTSTSEDSPRRPRPHGAQVAGPGVVVVHLFPQGGALFGPHFVARAVDLEGRRLALEVPLPEGSDVDPVDFAVELGADARAILLQDGCVLWETRLEVQRIEPGEDGSFARVIGLAARPAPPRALRAFEPADV